MFGYVASKSLILNLRMSHLLKFQIDKKKILVTHVTNKIIINQKCRKCVNLFKPLIKENIK